MLTSIGHHCLFSKRAREYMLIAYSILDNSDESGTTEGVEEEENKPYMTACLLIEKIVKQDKSQGSVSDFDTGFINRIIEATKDNQYHQ